MTKKDKALIVEALNQICAYMGAIATILGDDDVRSRDRPKATEAKQPEDATPTEEKGTPTAGITCDADTPEEAPDDDNSEPTAATTQPETAIPTAEPTPTPEPAPPAAKIKYEDVRAILAEKARTGYRAEVKALLTAHGVSQLSDADPAIYTQLLAEAEGIGNG